MILEELLINLNPKHNVTVLCNTAHAIFLSETEEPTMITDCLGNHHSENWLDAIRQNVHLQDVFTIGSVVNKDDENTTVWLDIPAQDERAKRLDIDANDAAIRNARIFS